jgi:putative peptide zinc metalloprotease protein
LTFGVRQVNGSVVDPQNAAVAIASCADCQTVAISVEVVLAGGDTTTVTPVNEAIAINESCTSCDTLAAAYQFVYALDTKLKLTAQGHQQLAEIRQQLEQLRNSGLSIEQINAEVEALMGQLNSVLNKELIAVSEPAAGPGTETTAITTLNPTPAASPPTDPTTTQTSTPTDTSTTPTTAPTDTTNTGAATGPTDSSMTPTPAPTDTTNTGTATGPTDSSTTPTATPTTATP